LLPVTEVETNHGVVLDLIVIHKEYEVVLCCRAALVKAHQETDFVIDVFVALGQIRNQQATAIYHFEDFVGNGIAVPFVDMVNAYWR